MIRKFVRKIYFFLKEIFYYPLLNRKFYFYFRNKENYIFNTELITKNNSLDELADKYGTDKGGDVNRNISKKEELNNYTPLYQKLFSRDKNNYRLVFEVGIGSNNLDTPSNMGSNGKPGASLYMWKEYFPNAEIFGADIDKRILFNENRIKTYFVDQYSTESIKKMWLEIDRKNFDIIIDDGIHDYKGNINFFENSIQYLKKGGLYIIEDVNNIYVENFRKYFSNLYYDVEIIDYYHKLRQYIKSRRIIVIYK